jgi:hypothetical protein
MTTSENHENLKRKVMAKGYCQPRKKEKRKAMATITNEEKNIKKGDGNKHEPKKNMKKG